MTPVASWSPGDYHRAFNRCRAAWEKSSPQLTIDGWADMMDGLDRTPNECRRRPVEPASSPAGSQPGAEPSRGPSPHAADPPDGGPSAPSFNDDGGGRKLSRETRVHPRKGV